MAPLMLISALVASYMCYVEGQSTCSPPRGGSGSCISLYDCEELMAIVNKPNKSQQDIQLLKRSQCGYDGNVPRVCCPSSGGGGGGGGGCFTPDGEQGTCVGIYSCQHLSELLTPPVSRETIAFVQSSRCNGPEQYSVCCGPPRSVQPVRPPPVQNGVCTMAAAPPDPRSKCCGVDALAGNRIQGGNATAVDQYPWLALIEYVKNNRIKLLCGAVLISGRYVLTAGHCVAGPVLNSGTPRNVRLGEYDTSKDGEDCVEAPGGGQDCTEGVTIIAIEQIIPHPQYDPSHALKRNDIALIRLRQTAPFTDFIRPICLPTTDITANPPFGLTLWVAGWGAVNETVSKSEIKLHVGVPFKTRPVCQVEYTKPRRRIALWEGQICAGGELGKDSCKGDSGGPLMYENDDHIFEVVGIVSFGPSPCGLENVPGVYTKVFEYNSWIRSQIRP